MSDEERTRQRAIGELLRWIHLQAEAIRARRDERPTGETESSRRAGGVKNERK
jgi:hypothetical protein